MRKEIFGRILTLLALTATWALSPASICLYASDSLHSEKINYSRFIRLNGARSVTELMDEASGCRARERYDSAAAYYSVIANLYSESLSPAEIRKCAIASVNLGYILLGWEMNAAEAYPWLMRADLIAEKHDMPDIRTSVISNLGRMYLDYNNIHKAFPLLKTTLLKVMQQKTDRYFGMSLMDFATVAMFSPEDSLTRQTVASISSYPLSRNAPLYEYSRKLTRALDTYISGEPLQAAHILEGADSLIDVSSEHDRYVILHLLVKSRMLMKAGNFGKAADTLRKAIPICEKEKYYNLLEKCYSILIECLQSLGETAEAGRFRYRALEIRDSLFNSMRFDRVKDMEKSMALKDLKSDVVTADLRSQRQRHMSIVLGCATLILSALLIWIAVSRRKLKDSYTELFKRNMELSESHTRLQDLKVAAPATEETATEGTTPAPDPTPAPDDGKDREVMNRVTGFMETSAVIYSPDFSVETLAESIGSRPKAVSHAINLLTGKNFNTYLGEFRVREACRLMSDTEKMKTMTIESVSEAVGYKSRTYFSRLFKNVTGLTPTQFMKEAMTNSRKSNERNEESV